MNNRPDHYGYQDSIKPAWDAYWRDGRISACREDERGLYRGAIGAFWRAYFERCGDGERILDLATGNGALLHLAAGIFGQRVSRVVCIGTDRARIQPAVPQIADLQENLSVHLLGMIANEALPFGERTFDRIISQYGVEYGDLPRTINEAHRILQPGGEICWLCHWRAGHIADSARREAKIARRLLELDLQDCIARLLRRQIADGAFLPDSHRLTSDSPERKELNKRLNEAFAMVSREGFGQDSNLSIYLHNLAYLYQHREQYTPDLVLSKIMEVGEQLAFHACRIEALYSSALNEESIRSIESELISRKFNILEMRPFVDTLDGKTVGYLINARLVP